MLPSGGAKVRLRLSSAGLDATNFDSDLDRAFERTDCQGRLADAFP